MSATALGAAVDNFSISGGGLIGPIEAYVLSGALAAGTHDQVIWEFPFTESLNTTSALRQLLGVLPLTKRDRTAPRQFTLDANARAEFDIAADAQPALLVIKDLPPQTQKVFVDDTLANGSDKTIQLRRKPGVLARSNMTDWAADLGGLGRHPITSIRLRLADPEAGKLLSLYLGV